MERRLVDEEEGGEEVEEDRGESSVASVVVSVVDVG